MARVHLLRRTAKDEDDPPDLSAMDRQIKRRRFTPARLAGAFLLIVGLIASAYIYWTFGLNRSLTVGAERISLSTVRIGTFRDYIPVTGNVVPQFTVYLDAIEGGQVTEVFVEEGEFTEAGAPLVKLKNTTLQLEVLGREAQVTEQLTNLSNSRLALEQNRLKHKRDLADLDYEIDRLARELRRRRPLLAKEVTPASEVDDLEAEHTYRKRLRELTAEAQEIDEKFRATQVDQLEQSLLGLNKNLTLARENLEALIIRAPIAGQLTSFEAFIGESKAPGRRLGQIDQVGRFKVRALVDEFYIGRVAAGQRASLEFDRETHELEVAKIYPEVLNRQFEIDLYFIGETPKAIRRGQTLRMSLELGEASKSLLIDNGPFFEDTGGRWAFVVAPSGAYAERQSLTLGRRNPETIEIVSGLNEGERVITSSYSQFSGFDRINLQGEKAE